MKQRAVSQKDRQIGHNRSKAEMSKKLRNSSDGLVVFLAKKHLKIVFKGVQRKNGYNYTICALHRGCLLSALLFQREKNNCLTRKQKRKAVSDPLP